ncbi:MAG: ATP-binding cassette domain-containing protein [Methylococcales bacterium]|nr:ATP-binding cassette domain-containing protein [Methylococcales bacterium]
MNTEHSYLIDADQVSKTVNTASGPLTILQPTSLRLKAAESLAIVGESGSGKTTLLGLLAGLDDVSSGRITLAGQELTAMNKDKRALLRNQTVGFVFQSFQLLPALTALDNVMLPLQLVGAADAKARAQTYLERVGLKHRLDHTPRQLSGGEQQRVALARAFVTEPLLLFADEPTGNLDRNTGQTLIELLFELNQAQQTTLVLVTHDIHLAERCQHRLSLPEGVWS